MRLNWLILGFVTFCTFTAQAAKVTSLKIEGNTVIFTQSGTKTAASPACAASKPTSWGLQLLTDSDRATYAALVAAAGSNMNIVVTSAQDCVEGTAIERINSVEVIPVIAAAVPQGMKIVAVGYYQANRRSAYVSYTATSPNGLPYMAKTDYGDHDRVECGAGASTFVTHDTSFRYVQCLIM